MKTDYIPIYIYEVPTILCQLSSIYLFSQKICLLNDLTIQIWYFYLGLTCGLSEFEYGNNRIIPCYIQLAI